MNKQINLQDVFLNTIRKERVEVTVFLTNGYQIKGVIRGYDNYVIMIETDGNQQVVFKHAVSTIRPMRPVQLKLNQEEEGSED
ncbi:MAG: RNA chaperone Hfq [Firmicutes bacterium]|nr:RNA chaperone Hfq [Bacillota bacterium]